MRLDDGKQESGNLEIIKVYIGDAIFPALLPLLKLVSAFTAISIGGRPMQGQQASAGEFWAQSLAMVGPRVGKKRMKLGKQATRLVYYFSCTLHLEDPDKGCQELFQAIPSSVSKHEDCEPVSCIVALTNLNCFMHQEWPYLQKTRSSNIGVSQPLVYSCSFGVSA